MLGGLWSNHDPNFLVGTPWLILGRYNHSSGVFNLTTKAQPVDSGNTVIWSTIDQVADGRTLHVGWFNGPGTSNCLTVPRSITYDPSQRKLLAQPIAELALLRSAQPIARANNLALRPHGVAQLLGRGSAHNSTSVDMEFDFELPSATAALSSIEQGGQWMTMALLANNATSEAAVYLHFNLSLSGAGSTVLVNMSAEIPHQPPRSNLNTTISFLLPQHAKQMHLRVIIDRSIVEIFAGHGRGVVSLPILKPATSSDVFVRANSLGLTVYAIEAWEMGCGWAEYP